MQVEFKFPTNHSGFKANAELAERVEGFHLMVNEKLMVEFNPDGLYYICIKLEASRLPELLNELLSEGYLD